MTSKKNGFLAFIFSLLPGAGEMYMGFMKQGVSLMGVFFLLVFLSSWLNMGPLLFVLPILWFYGFFHVHNLRGMSEEEFYAVEDDYLFHMNQILPEKLNLDKKARNLFAAVLIIIGVVTLGNNLLDFMRWILPDYLMELYWRLMHGIPQFVVAILCIWGGIWLIRGKKKELDEKENAAETTGGDPS